VVWKKAVEKKVCGWETSSSQRPGRVLWDISTERKGGAVRAWGLEGYTPMIDLTVRGFASGEKGSRGKSPRISSGSPEK